MRCFAMIQWRTTRKERDDGQDTAAEQEQLGVVGRLVTEPLAAKASERKQLTARGLPHFRSGKRPFLSGNAGHMDRFLQGLGAVTSDCLIAKQPVVSFLDGQDKKRLCLLQADCGVSVNGNAWKVVKTISRMKLWRMCARKSTRYHRTV